MTKRLNATSEATIAEAAEILREGGTVAFPTETVYGLGANALDPTAVAKIFAAKDRPDWDPLIVHVSDRTMLDQIAVVTPKAELLIAAFWPGALTLLLERTSAIPDAVTAGRPLVGVRMPAHPVAAALIRAAGIPIAAPSANRFGRTSPTTAAHVLEDLDNRIDAILDGGPTTVGLESTVLDPNQNPMLIYRPGAVTAAMIEKVAGPVQIFQPKTQPSPNTPPQSLPSPGVGIRHYAPRAKLILVANESELNTQLKLAKHDGPVGVMLPQDWHLTQPAEVFAWGGWEDGQTLALNLFAGLRDLDTRKVSTIICPLPPATGIGLATRDRLQKAARTN
jgi:L-threonylcarbamoyladenylate synthase